MDQAKPKLVLKVVYKGVQLVVGGAKSNAALVQVNTMCFVQFQV